MDFGFSNLTYNDHKIVMKIANDPENKLKDSFYKLKNELFGCEEKDSKSFCLNKLLKLSSIMDKKNFNNKDNVEILITSSIPETKKNSFFSYFQQSPSPPPPKNLKFNSTVDEYKITDKEIFEKLYVNEQYNQQKFQIYSNMDESNNILINNEQIIDVQFNLMINNIIKNKI